MSRLRDLLRELRAENPVLAADLEKEVDALADRRAFGLNFERHVPEAVELPGRPVRRGDKVRILPPRGETPKSADERLWRVTSIDRDADGARAELEILNGDETASAALADLVVVAEFRDPIYPGLVSTGKVERGGDKPFHTVINAENYHALELLTYTHAGKVDAIYIDPPYNTGAKDWKYNNDYVEGDDLYRHSKWLAFMERRLKLAKALLNPDDSVLIVTIDEKEYLRLGLLLEQTFADAGIQMITSVINPRAGVSRPDTFSRAEEYLYYVQVGGSTITPAPMAGDGLPNRNTAPIWFSLMRTGSNSSRQARPNLFYPIWVMADGRLHSVGEPLDLTRKVVDVIPPAPGLRVAWPTRPDGTENTWQLGASTIREAFQAGTARINLTDTRVTINYLRKAEQRRIAAGEIDVVGRDEHGALILRHAEGAVRLTRPRTVWNSPGHDAGLYGSSLLKALLPEANFPFPKALYAVEDALRFVVTDKPNAQVVDFFSGSGTTAHAIMRLNKQDAGSRRCISVTNNEVGADEQKKLCSNGLRPGDPDWEKWGICEYVTKPRIKAAITGKTPDGEPIKGEYKFTDIFPMSDGFEENVEFFTLTYEAPLRVSSNREFAKIAPLLWLRAGAHGRRVDEVPGGWDISDTYGVLVDLDQTAIFVEGLKEFPDVRIAFVITDEDRLFESVARDLPDGIEPVRLYESYLRNFEVEVGRSAL